MSEDPLAPVFTPSDFALIEDTIRTWLLANKEYEYVKVEIVEIAEQLWMETYPLPRDNDEEVSGKLLDLMDAVQHFFPGTGVATIMPYSRRHLTNPELTVYREASTSALRQLRAAA